MAAIVGRLIREAQANAAVEARDARALSRDHGAMAPVGEIWSRQLRNAVVFPTYGVIPRSLLRWQRADGTVHAFGDGRQDDVLVAPVWALERGRGR